MTTDGRTLRLAFATSFALTLVVGVAIGMSVMVRGYSPVPFADFWNELGFIRKALDGDVGVGDFWAQHNEHRIVVARLQFLVDYGLFSGTNVFLFGAIAASSLALAATFAVAVYLDTRDRLVAFGALAVAAAAAMSAAGMENLTWAFQVQFVQVFLFSTLAILAVVVAARSPNGRRRAWLVALCAGSAIAATYSMANGFLSWPVVVGLAFVLGLERRLAIALTLAGVATVTSFFWRLDVEPRSEASEPLDVLTFVAAYLGAAVWKAGFREAVVVGALGLTALPVLGAVAVRRRPDVSIALPFGVGVATYVVLSALQTAVGRIHLGTQQALASRYSIASFTFWLALLVALLVVLRVRWPRQVVALVYLACAAAVALLISYRTIPDPDFLRTTQFGRTATVLAYRAGVTDDAGTVTGVAAGIGLDDPLRWLESERLGPWAPGGLADEMQVSEDIGTASRPCRGAIEESEPVTRGHRLRGWIVSPGGEQTSRNLVVLESGRRAGLGLVGTHRPDVVESGLADSEWTGFVAYLRSKPADRLSVVLVSEDGATPVCGLVTPGA